jgi:PAS domain S-box-containing protein
MINPSTPRKFILLIIGGLFISEMISMGIIALSPSLSYFKLTLIDSFLLILFATPLLYYFSLRPLLKVISEREAEIVRRQEIEIQLRTQTTALETAANGVIITDRQGKILWANQAFARMTGYSVPEILGTTPKLLNSGTHDSKFFKNLWETILSGNAWHGEVTNRRKDGSLYIDEQTITPVLNSAGGIENFISIHQDVTERKQSEIALRASEEKFRTLLDWTYDWAIWTDPQNKVMYNSPSCQRITGYPPEQFITNPELLTQIVHPDEREIFEDHLSREHGESVGAITLEYRIIARDGSEHWIGHNCRPIFGTDSRYLGRRVSNRDITESKLAEKDIEERARKEKVLTETIHTMQLDIARDLHDTVGQNISYLKLNLNHLSDASLQLPADLQAEIKNMTEAANESYDLIRGTLAVLQSKNSDDLFQLFTRYAQQVEERSAFRIDFSHIGETRPLSANQMRQLFYVFREALNNIEKHANASQIFIKMLWDKDCLTLLLLDNGCGFDTTSLQDHGHYGLKFMRERIEQMKGSISIDSVIGTGTNITVSVPYE